MPSDKDILKFSVDKELMKRLDDFRFDDRIDTIERRDP
jgi:hypothetical protein